MQLSDLRERGVALIFALALMVVVAGVAALMFARTLNEVHHSGDDAAIVQTLMLARGGANYGGQLLAVPVKGDLSAIVQAESSTTARWSFGTGNGAQPDPASVATALTVGSSSVAGLLQAQIDARLCGGDLSPVTGGTLRVRIWVTDTACVGTEDLPLPSGARLPDGRFVGGSPRDGSSTAAAQWYAVPYVMASTGTLAGYRRNVVVQGEFRFEVGRSSFAQYALFTNVHESPGGSDVWFTGRTLFDGPVHTNQYFRFYTRPWFGDRISSAGCNQPLQDRCRSNRFDYTGAEFYGSGFRSVGDMIDPNHPSFTNRYGTHAPDLVGGANWNSGFVPLPSNAQDQANAAATGGLFVVGDLDALQMWASDGSGDPLTKQVDGTWGPAATYQYIRTCDPGGGAAACHTYRYGADGDLYEQDAGGAWNLVRSGFNGVVYVDGTIASFSGPARTPPTSDDAADAPPALASFAQLTVSTAKDIRITGDLTYEDAPCAGAPTRQPDGSVTPAVCDNLGADNVLGVYTPSGDILIGNGHPYNSGLNAPYDVTIDGVLMTGAGSVTVEAYNAGLERGNVNLLGGVIEYYYGPFGQFDPNTGASVHGYSRRFTFDQRMAAGLAPPFFPTVGDDQVRNVYVYSFGQREQVY